MRMTVNLGTFGEDAKEAYRRIYHPTPEEQREDRIRREAQAEVDALAPLAADLPPSLPDSEWVTFLKWLRRWV